MKYTNKQINALLDGIFDGSIDPRNLPEDLYLATAEYLAGGLFKGFGGTLADFEGAPLQLLEELRENVYLFSSAKTYQQTVAMSEALYDGERIRTKAEFKEAAGEIFTRYNGGDFEDERKAGYIDAEYETAITQGQNAQNWIGIERDKETLPYLQKVVVEDENTCEICGPLDGMTAPVDDPVWNTLAGELHFRCRCSEIQLDKEEGESLYDADKVEQLKESQESLMKPMFKHNVYKSGAIFDKQHPYFSVPKEDKEFAASNFGLPIPEED